ncbi:MAG: YkvA family protein [Thermodesulfobacteriota bacterium]
MFTSSKTVLKIFSTTALLSAYGILKSTKNLNELIDTASKEIDFGKKKVISIQSETRVLISMLKSWVKGDYTDIPWMTLLLSVGALVYFVNPLDAVPDIVPAVGLLDDATVIGFVLASIKQDLQNFKIYNSTKVEESQQFNPA